MIEAVVQVGASVTRYLRCGRGQRSIVVLAESEAERLRLIREAGEECCVIAPLTDTPPDDGAAFDEWLRGIIEGLGLEAPHIVLSPGLEWLAGRLNP